MTTIIFVSTKAAKVINAVNGAIKKSPTGVSFFSIKGYTNNNGEVADHVFNIGADYSKMKDKDIKFLKELDITKHSWESPMVLIEKARVDLIKAFEKPNKNISDAQKDAYTHIVPGVKVHNENGGLYIYGNRVSKNVLVKGVYEPSTKQALTKAKDELRKLLKTSTFRMFIVSDCETIKGNGETIEIG